MDPLGSLSVRFSRQEYWNELPYSFPGDLPNPGIELMSLISPELAGGFTTNATYEARYLAKVTPFVTCSFLFKAMCMQLSNESSFFIYLLSFIANKLHMMVILIKYKHTVFLNVKIYYIYVYI